MTVTTIDPATGDPPATYEETGTDEHDAILERAHTAAASRRLTPPAQRADTLGRLASALRDETVAMPTTAASPQSAHDETVRADAKMPARAGMQGYGST